MAATMLAHDWEILGGERIPRWPSEIKEKRPLGVRIYTWVGTSAIGAKHFNAEVNEEQNQWWCEDRNAWVTLSCDGERDGVSMRASVLTEGDAIKMAMHFVELVTGPKRAKHIVSWDGPGKPKWARQG